MLAAILVAMTSLAPASATTVFSATPRESATKRPCPGDLDYYATCYGGQDRNGAFYLIALPAKPVGVLIVHAHGGPRHIEPASGGSDEDLVRFSVMVRSGYSWIGTTYRTGGYGVRSAAADVDIARSIYWKHFGRPSKTILHGQSYGGNVIAKLAELEALDENGHRIYDGVLLTGAAVGKRIRTYDALINTRVVYQYFCRNLPYPNEVQYPGWHGLPRQTSLTRDDVRQRLNECTGIDSLPTSRTAQQSQNLEAILGASGLEERQLAHQMQLATFRFHDVIHNFLKGLNPFDNSKTIYRGSGQDAALNAGVERFTGTSFARDLLAYDSDLRGNIIVPTITLHAKFDPVVSYRSQVHYKEVVDQAGQSHLLMQLLTSEDQHSKLSDSEYMATLTVLMNWIDMGQKPTIDDVTRICDEFASKNGQPCLFLNTKDQ